MPCTRKWTVLLLLLVLVSLTIPAFGQRGRRGKRKPIPELVQEIREERDGVSNRVLYDLVSYRNQEALEALQSVVDLFRSPEGLQRVYSQFFYFNDEAFLREPAVEFLRTEGLGASRSAARVAATSTLQYFGDEGAIAAETILFQSKDEKVRAEAAKGALSLLARRQTPELLVRVLDDLPAPAYPALRAALRTLALPPEARREVFLPRIEDPRRPEEVRLALLDRLADDTSEGINAILAALVNRSTPALQQHALEILYARGEERRVEARLFKLIRSRHADLRLIAIRALGRVAVDDPRWAKQLEALAKSRDATDRIGAVYSLLEQRSPAAVERLYGYLDDEDWRVRAVALQGIVALRRPDSLPLLIARLDAEGGRMRADVLNALELLTGLSLGRNVERWKKWWSVEGEDIVLPSREEVRQRQAARAQRRSEDESVATFYGLPVLSDRVCFVVDSSGSMREPAHMDDRSSSDGRGPTRFTVAMEQLRTLFQRIPDGERTNLVFFESRVHPWSKKLRVLDERMRANALDFIDDTKAGGGTNLYDALELAIDDPLVDTIYILSDGEPTAGRLTDANDILEAVHRINRRRQIVIHGVSVGRRSGLLRALAADSGGQYAEVGIPPPPRRERILGQ